MNKVMRFLDDLDEKVVLPRLRRQAQRFASDDDYRLRVIRRRRIAKVVGYVWAVAVVIEIVFRVALDPKHALKIVVPLLVVLVMWIPAIFIANARKRKTTGREKHD